ncbi:MAG: hypothetical protein JJLCMIEE_00550 [Acidimicrobiales bacterium]|nr:MAG: M48 family peptidase [Actinomycetota bacterium]MBV6507501.1 hypothetical protein [Acidimicrobiales bacterium]RIK07877.1 MAG: metal-dependent hydrolase [Acidobacteriota bacterium]
MGEPACQLQLFQDLPLVVHDRDQRSPELPALSFEVIRSSRRRKTVQARLVNGVVEIRIPAAMSAAEERRWVNDMLSRFERSLRSAHIDLPERAASLARRYGLPEPANIRWVDNMTTRWGSCTIDDSTIRICSETAEFPRWVLDYIIVHELAHLVEANHSKAFWTLVGRYPKTERARGFLIARGLDG